MPAEHRFVVTGTDTEVGKTVVGAGLSRAWADAGLTVVAVKPVESGCDGGHIEDGVCLATASRQSAPKAALRRYTVPVAPPLAAEMAGETLTFAPLVEETIALTEHADVALVEGAGGLLSPLTWEHTAIDLAKALDARLIVVAADRLGTLNHTQLVLQAADTAGLEVAALVLSSPREDEGDRSIGRNARAMHTVGVKPLPVVLGPAPTVVEAADQLRALAHRLVAP